MNAITSSKTSVLILLSLLVGFVIPDRAAAQTNIVRFVGAETGGLYALHEDGTISLYPISGNVLSGPEDLGTMPAPNPSPLGWPATVNDITEWPALDHLIYNQDGVFYSALLDGGLAYARDVVAAGVHSWQGAGLARISLGNGWAEYRWVLGDGNGILYAIDRQGLLYFYQHSGAPNNTWPVGSGSVISTGWGGFKMVIPGRQGILYAIDHDGNFYYNRDLTHTGAPNTVWQFPAPVTVGNGWNRFQHVVSTGGGDIYGIEALGDVYHYHLTVTTSGSGAPIADWSGSDYVNKINANGVHPPVKMFKGVYCWPLSVAPGGTLNVTASCDGPGTLRFVRMIGRDAPEPLEDALHVLTVPITGGLQPVWDAPARDGCGWRTNYTLTIPADWPSGTYSVHCYTGANDTFDSDECTFIVKPSPLVPPSRRVAVLANVNTWNAYSDRWGGGHYALDRGNMSFLRPSSFKSRVRSGWFHLCAGELWVQGWLETTDINPATQVGRYAADVFTDIDLHDGTFDLSSYCCLVVSTHPEYWSDQMYQRLKTYLDSGGNLIYLGGNGLYERVNYSAGRETMILDGGVDLFAFSLLPNNGFVHAGPSLFRGAPAMHEQNLLSVSTAACGIIGGGYTLDPAYRFDPGDPVNHPGHPLLTGVTPDVNGLIGDTVGLHIGAGRGEGCNGKAAGLETDNTISAAINAPACATIQGPAVFGLGATAPPAGTVVLGTARVADGGGDAQIVYRPAPGGGFILGVGSVTFGGCLFRDTALQALVGNALARSCARIPNITRFNVEPSFINKFRLRMEGNPGAGYVLEQSLTCFPPWTAIASYAFGDLEGQHDFLISNTNSQGFYRVRRQ